MKKPDGTQPTDSRGVEPRPDAVFGWLEAARRIDPDAAQDLAVQVLSGQRPVPTGPADAVRLVRSILRSRLRTERRRLVYLAELGRATIQAAVDRQHGWVELRELVEELQRRLHPLDVAIFCLLAQGWQAAQVAFILGLSAAAVRQRVCRVRRRLRPLQAIWLGGRA